MVELLFTVAGAIAGIAVVASLLQQREARKRFAAKPAIEADPAKINAIAEQLSFISRRVAQNVTAHSAKVETFNDRLNIEDFGEQPDAIFEAINEILSANESMQNELANAQDRIHKQTALIEQTSKQARTDALTGLSNRRALDEYLTNALDVTSDHCLTGLLLMDIDHFKSFNDTFGHTTGDAVLASFARSLTECCTDEDYPARYGGEEFAVVLEGETPEELVEKSAKIRHYVSEQIISYDSLELNVTASAGLCLVQEDDSISSVYERADEGLYKSKKAGRNRGYWLAEKTWTPFPKHAIAHDNPTINGAEPAAATLKSSETLVADSNTNETQPDSAAKADTAPRRAVTSSNSGAMSEVLDLKSFVDKFEIQLDQLRRADLPATALMVEAKGLVGQDSPDLQASWEATVAVIQVNLRGIDMVCLFRPFTLCIFMPGCSEDAALERASKLFASFGEAKGEWSFDVSAKNLGIAAAPVMNDETTADFLNRLEQAVDETQQLGGMEVVVHSGDGFQVQSV